MIGDLCHVCGERISGNLTMDKGMTWIHSNSKTERESDHQALTRPIEPAKVPTNE